MNYPKPVVRLMADVVTAMAAKVLPVIQAAELAQRQVTQPDAVVSNIQQINYQFGHLKELIATMKEYEKDPASQALKYPLVALLLDFNENMGNAGGYISEVSLQMIIAYAESDPTLKASQRYTKNFEPILLPIYYELLNQIDEGGQFVSLGVQNIRHTKTDHPYWGKGGITDTSGNVFPDYIDAIELSNLLLKVNFSQCS